MASAYQCDFCPRTFASLADARSHEVERHIKMSCHGCGSQFASSEILRAHVEKCDRSVFKNARANLGEARASLSRVRKKAQAQKIMGKVNSFGGTKSFCPECRRMVDYPHSC